MLTCARLVAIIGEMASKGESVGSRAGTGWLTSGAALRVVKWATRMRAALAGAGALALFALVDRGPMWPGVAVALGGELIQLWASAHLRKNLQLVKSGPYAWLRNPMYLGRFFVGLGLAMLTWRWFIVLPYIVGFWVYAQARVLGEEARLRELFGEEYAEFCGEVNRWLPTPPRNRLSEARGSLAAVLRNHQLRVTAGVVLTLIVLKLRVEVWGSSPPWG
jgi:protein-S-isoprenylcysteine O-methyltransferase Ste14